MRSFGQLWPTLKRLLVYGKPWRKPLTRAVVMLWIAAIAEVSGPALISYFIDNMVAKSYLPLGLLAGVGGGYHSLPPAGARGGQVGRGAGWGRGGNLGGGGILKKKKKTKTRT